MIVGSLNYWIVLCLMLFQGSSQTDDSSSQRTSSSVLAKEALIEIDYNNLSEDLKVRVSHYSVLYEYTVVQLGLIFDFLSVSTEKTEAFFQHEQSNCFIQNSCRIRCQKKRSRQRQTHCSSVWMSSRVSSRGSVLPIWRPWRSLRVSGTNSKRPAMVRWSKTSRDWREMML